MWSGHVTSMTIEVLCTQCLMTYFLIGVLSHTPEYLTYVTTFRIEVDGNQAVLRENPWPSAGFWHTFPLTKGEEDSVSLTWTHSDRIRERLQDYCTGIAHLLTVKSMYVNFKYLIWGFYAGLTMPKSSWITSFSWCADHMPQEFFIFFSRLPSFLFQIIRSLLTKCVYLVVVGGRGHNVFENWNFQTITWVKMLWQPTCLCVCWGFGLTGILWP